MKGALIALFSGIALLVIIYFRLTIYRGKTSFDIQFHDTYFILDYGFSILLAFIFLGTFFSVGGIIGTRFRSKLFWILSVLFLAIDAYFVVVSYQAFSQH
jgi:hypothetical protein